MRAGRGQEVARQWGCQEQGGGRAGERGRGGKKGAFGGPPVPSLTPAPHPTPPPLGVSPCKEERAPRSHSPRGARFWSSGTLGARGRLPRGGLTPAPPPTLPAPRGRLYGAGELLHCVSQGRRGGRRGPRRPPPSPAVCPQPSPHGSFSLNVLQRRLPPAPHPQPQIPRQLCSLEPGQRPMPWGAAHARPVRLRGVWARAAGPGSSVPRARGHGPEAEALYGAATHPPLKHKPTVKPTLGFQSVVRVSAVWKFFGYFPLSGRRGGGLHMHGSAPVLSQRPGGPPPPCSICVQRAKCPPFPQKRAPPASEKGGVQKGDESIPPPKRESKLKKI